MKGVVVRCRLRKIDIVIENAIKEAKEISGERGLLKPGYVCVCVKEQRVFSEEVKKKQTDKRR